jgi:competence protein ComEA
MPDPLHPLPPPVEPPTWRTRVDALAARLGVAPARVLRWGAAGLLTLVVAVVALVSWRSSSAPAELGLPRATPARAPATGDATSTTTASATAHAAGAILRPGVYRLPPGARVTDLIDAAGGPASDADLDQLNLAALGADGERVYVPRKGEAPPPVGGTAAGGAPTPAGPVDLNTATAEQLDTLPGVGPATAAAIRQYRSEHGRFRAVDDLLEVPGIGEAKLDHLRSLVKV